eukprot:scaffold17416_cov72-Skeletonema_dohrnii-CCMP3373.AAC.1
MATLSTIIQEHEQEFASLELSETIHELQTQLQVALEVASGLKEENGHLKTSLEDCRASNAAQQRRSEEWRNAWKKEVGLVSKREKKLQHDENAWDAKLAEKRGQLDELESQLVKKKDEMDSTHESNAQGGNNQNQDIKIGHLEKEIDKWRKQFFEAQKMSEEIQQMESKYLREAEMAKVLRKEITSLQKMYADYLEKDNSNPQAKCQEKTRELTRKVDEMDLVAEKLREETKEMRKSRDEAIAKCDELKAKHQIEHGKTLRDCAKYEAMSVTLQERILIAERDAKESAAVTRGLEESLESARKDAARLKDTLVAKKAEYEEEMKQLQQDIMKSEHKLRAQLTQAQQLLSDEKDKSAKAELHYKEAHESHIQSIKELAKEFEGNRDDTKEKLLEAQDRIRHLENKLSNLEGEKVQLLHNHQADMQRLKHACESCHNDLNLALLQKEEASTMCEAMSSKASQQTKQLEEYELAVMKADEHCQLLENEKLMMQRKVDELNLENKALEQRMQIILDSMLAAKKEAGIWKDKSSEAKKKAGEAVKEVRGQLSKEQRRSEAYKEKALEAHQRNIEAKRVLESLRKDSK